MEKHEPTLKLGHSLLNSPGAEYVVGGAFALPFHSEPRFTGGLDLFLRRLRP